MEKTLKTSPHSSEQLIAQIIETSRNVHNTLDTLSGTHIHSLAGAIKKAKHHGIISNDMAAKLVRLSRASDAVRHITPVSLTLILEQLQLQQVQPAWYEKPAEIEKPTEKPVEIEKPTEKPAEKKHEVLRTLEIQQVQYIDRVIDVPVQKKVQVPRVQKVQKTVEAPKKFKWKDKHLGGFEAKATAGDTHLSGEDIDIRIVDFSNHLVDFKRKTVAMKRQGTNKL